MLYAYFFFKTKIFIVIKRDEKVIRKLLRIFVV